MGLFKNKYRIESARRQGFDYSQDGYYFITICTKNRILFFGNVVNGKMVLSDIGNIANGFWQKIPEHFGCVKLDYYVVMPNHVHMILCIDCGDKTDGAITTVETRRGAPEQPRGVEQIYRGASEPICIDCGDKTDGAITTVETRRGASLRTHSMKFGPLRKNSVSSIINHYKGGVTKLCRKYNTNFVWQSRFHDKIIRDENKLNRVRQYIINNPLRWELDKNNKNNLYI